MEQTEHVLRSACSDLGRRIRAGEMCSAEEYLAQHAELAANPDLAIELIYTEYVVRAELNQDVSYEDWLTRFPQWRSDLEQLIEVHRQVCGEVRDGSKILPQRPQSQRELDRGPIAVGTTVGADRRVGNYELVEEIGRGGMGVVYRARQVGLNRQVALKMVLSGDFASLRELQRFQTEAEAAARLHHPNIVQIFEVSAHEGRPYFSMEFVAGGRLDEALILSPLPPRIAAELISRLARAVHYAHQRGVVHRDLKPSNILLAPSDRDNGVPLGTTGDDLAFYEPKIADFGLAKQFTVDDAKHTRSCAVVGTPSYMSPEQARGKSAEIGPASDVYSLGAILYESLTGRPPFLGNSPLETLRQVTNDDPVSPSQMQPKLPRDLTTICSKCLEKEPLRRYASASDLAEDLRRYLTGEPIRAKPVRATEWMVKWARRRPAITALAATLVAVSTIGFAGVFMLWRTAESGRATAVQERHKAETLRNAAEFARSKADAARAAAERTLYFYRIAQAHAEWQAFQIGRAEDLLDECPPPMRDWEWSYLQSLCHTDLRTMRGHTHAVSCVAYSPDGKLVASGTGQWAQGRSGEIILWDAATGETQATLRGQHGHITSVAFSPDGQKLASSSVRWDSPEPSSVVLWNIAGEKLHTLPVAGAWEVAFTPDGRHLVTASPDVRLWNAETGEQLHVFTGHTASIFDISVSPDGSRVASVSRDGSLRIWNLKRRDEEFAVTGYGDLRRVSFSPDGRFLAFSGYADTLWIIDLAAPTNRPWSHHLFNDRIVALAYSPEGRRIALAGVDGSVRIIDVAHGKETGRELKVFHGHNGVATALAFSPDGRALVTGGVDRTVKLFDAQADYSMDTLNSGVIANFYRLLFTPDGSRMLLPAGFNRGSPGRGERVLVDWNLEQSVRIHTMQHDGWLTDASLSPDGSRVATASEDKLARIWDLANGEELQRLQHAAPVLGVAFDPDGGSVTTACADAILRTWNSATGELLREAAGHDGQITAVRHSPDGSWLASAGGDGTVRLWNAGSGTATHVLRGHSGTVNSIAFSHDSQLLASAGADATVRLWDVTAGKVIHVLCGHHDAVTDVCFSANNRRVASSSYDWTVKLWAVESGDEALTLRPKNPVLSVTFSPDGKRLVTSVGSLLRFWHAEPLAPSPQGTAAFDAANQAWHEREARQCEGAKQYFAAAFHLSRLMNLQSTRADLLRRRGHAFAELGEWEKAKADFTAALERNEGMADIFNLAATQIACGSRAGHRELCQRMLDAITDSSGLAAVNAAVWICVVVPNSISDTTRLVSLSERAVAGASDDTQRATFANTLAAALFRAGRLDDARSWFQKAIEYHGAGGTIEDWLFLAMIEQQRGNFDAARDWLAKSKEWLDEPAAVHPNRSPAASRWWDRVGWDLLRREAESFVRPPP